MDLKSKGSFLLLGAGWIFASNIGPAAAHPHVFADVKIVTAFDSDGRVKNIKNKWIFDEMYSAAILLGDADLKAAAKKNMADLREYDFFTFAKIDGRKVAFSAPIDQALTKVQDGRVELDFTLPLLEATRITRFMTIQVYDPEYFVDFELSSKEAAVLETSPPGCSLSILGANPLIVEKGKQVAKSFDAGQTAQSDFALSMASRVLVACP